MLVFKGGTALHHCYLPQLRFSEDIDFSCRVPGRVTLAQVKSAPEKGGLLEVRKEYVSPATIKIERLRYAGILGQPGAIKVEIDHLQNVLLEPRMIPCRNVWGLSLALPVMDIREIAAEKLRAACQRARYRDFYDLYLIVAEYSLSVEELVTLLRQKGVRQPITVEALRQNRQRAAREFSEAAGLVAYGRAVLSDEIAQMGPLKKGCARN